MLKRKDGISTDLRSKLRRLEEVSWNFDRARSRSAFSAVHFHPGRFISQLPSILISLFSEPNEIIFDPFCGSGTTLVEAQRLSRRSIGIDVNPISVLISQAKTLGIGEPEVTRILRGYFSAFSRARNSSSSLLAPPTVQIKKWYSRSVGDDLKCIFQIARNTRDETARALKLFCFSSILIKAARETRHWGYICDNSEPRDNPKRDVAALFEQMIEEIRIAYLERDQFVETTLRSIPKVHLGNAISSERFVAESSIDLIVTSPPYFGVVDYVKSQRLSMEWLEHDIEYYRIQEMGARSKRHRKCAIAEFEADLEAAFKACYKVLKPGRLCTIVFGASEARSFREGRLLQILESAKFEFIHDVNRDISIQRRQKPSILSECVYIFRKPSSDLLVERSN